MVESLDSVKRRQWMLAWWDQVREHFAETLLQFVVSTLALGVILGLSRDLTQAQSDLMTYLIAASVSTVIVGGWAALSAKARIASRGKWRGGAFVYHRPVVAWAGFRTVADNNEWIEVKVPDAPRSGLVQFRVLADWQKGVGIEVGDVLMTSHPPGGGRAVPLTNAMGPTGVRMIKGKRAFRVRFELEPEQDGRHLGIEVLQVATDHSA
jgi:hypothetical protein